MPPTCHCILNCHNGWLNYNLHFDIFFDTAVLSKYASAVLNLCHYALFDPL